MPGVEIHGYAIVSDNDCIADASGRTPDVLRNEADWAYFQAELGQSAVTVLGRLGHEANPNPKGRLRMILSSSSTGLERRRDGSRRCLRRSHAHDGAKHRNRQVLLMVKGKGRFRRRLCQKPE